MVGTITRYGLRPRCSCRKPSDQLEISGCQEQPTDPLAQFALGLELNSDTCFSVELRAVQITSVLARGPHGTIGGTKLRWIQACMTFGAGLLTQSDV